MPRSSARCVSSISSRAFGEEDRRLLRDLGRMAEQEMAALQLATIDELTLLSNRRFTKKLSILIGLHI